MKINKNLIHREIAGEHILIPVGESALELHGMITLTESGYLLWEKMHEECNEDDLVNEILKEYDIDETTARADVKEFVQKMTKIGILDQGGAYE